MREKGLKIVKEAVALALILVLTALIIVEATWIYTIEFSDAPGDVGDCPVFADILIIGYGFNETHVGFNITVNGNVPLQSSTTYWYGVLIDSDNDPSTGLAHWTLIGSDYLLEAWIDTTRVSTPGVKLYRYIGNGSSWEWSVVSNAEVLASVYGKTLNNDTIELVVGKKYLTLLSGEISFTVYVSGSGKTCDLVVVASGGEGPVPIPEPALPVAASIVIVSALSLFLIKDKL